MIRALVLCGLASTACASAPDFHPPPAAPNAPYSEAVRVGRILFLAGKIGRAPGSPTVVPGGIRAETRQAMENIRAVLARHGSSFERVVMCTVFLLDVEERPAMTEVYREFFSKHLPARSAVGVSGLALGARVEIECIATVDP